MKKKLLILAGLVIMTAVFWIGYFHFTDKHTRLHDQALAMEYKVLDKKVWTMEGAQKDAALSQDAAYDKISRIKKESDNALQRSKIGKWVSLLLSAATLFYLLHLLWYLVVVELIGNQKYRLILAHFQKDRDGTEES